MKLAGEIKVHVRFLEKGNKKINDSNVISFLGRIIFQELCVRQTSLVHKFFFSSCTSNFFFFSSYFAISQTPISLHLRFSFFFYFGYRIRVSRRNPLYANLALIRTVTMTFRPRNSDKRACVQCRGAFRRHGNLCD